MRVLSPTIDEFVPLASRTTLGLGGAARFFVQAQSPTDVAFALRWALAQNLPAFVLGGGSNLVVGDDGFAGIVIQLASRGQAWSVTADRALVEVQAGEPWDDVVAESVRRNLAGTECLSGIPGSAGAAPVQNIGAYGQEVGGRVEHVDVLDRRSLEIRRLHPAECGFAYRDSLFKQNPDRFVILSLTLAFRPGAAPTIQYGELVSALAATPQPTPAEVRQAVLALRRKKSMVFDPADDNRHSAGSFFTNPVVDAEVAERVVGCARARGIGDVPRFPQPDGRVKLAAGWLVEHAGIPKGFRIGPVGVSTRHALALVHHGGGSTVDLLRLALHIRATVLDRFGVSLVPEPVFLGVDWPG